MADLFTTQNLSVFDYKFSKSFSLYNGFLGYNLFVALRFIFKALEWTGHGVPWLIYSAYKLLVTKYSKAHLLLMLGLILDLIVIAVFKLIGHHTMKEIFL